MSELIRVTARINGREQVLLWIAADIEALSARYEVGSVQPRSAEGPEQDVVPVQAEDPPGNGSGSV